MLRWVSLLALISMAAAGQEARDLRTQKIAPVLPGGQTRWALVIGVSTYKYVPPAAQLRFAHRDAEDFAKLLRSREGGGLPASNVRLLTEEAATVGAIRAAVRTWLPQSAGANDVVYLYFAGHAVAAEDGESYFVAHDSDPQNLHATGLSFREVNQALTRELKAATVVLIADACHAGGIGWTSDPAALPVAAQRSLEALGAQDRAFLKLLASKPSERSFEDARWGGGHGVFTFSLLNGLQGAADRDRDGLVSAGELVDYVSRTVAEQTAAQQNPRTAGNFDASMALAAMPGATARRPSVPATLRITGAAGTAVYVDGQFVGTVRANGELLVGTDAGVHVLSADVAAGGTIDHPMTAGAGQTDVALEKLPEWTLSEIRARIRAGRVLGAGGAWEQFRGQAFPKAQQAEATAVMMAALEDTGMQCVSDYVQSTSVALKRPMFLAAAEAFTALKTLRPGDASLEAKALFCRARAHIAAGEFAEALGLLERSLTIDREFGCSYNALGVALRGLGRAREARSAFEQAVKLTPAWGLPPLEIAREFINAGDLKGAVPYLEAAVRLNPKAVGSWWSLARVQRVLGNRAEFERAAAGAVAADRNYAPIYAEMGAFYESAGDTVKAAQAYDAYLLLAPNFADSGEIRKRSQALVKKPAPAPAGAPTLRRAGERKP